MDGRASPWLHPPLAAWDAGWLDVGEGHAVHWQQAGHPGAPAVLVLHGGPGAGCSADDRRWFDPARWRIVLMDQRGAGASHAVDPLRANTTAHLVRDIEALRVHLGIGRWMLFGGSWGTTLALACARTYPQRVGGLVLRGVLLGTRAERVALYPHVDFDHHAIEDATAARAWLRREQDLLDAEFMHPSPAPTLDDATALRRARIELHYARQGWFTGEGLLPSLPTHLPCHIVQGLRDRVTPPTAARALHAAWPGSTLTELEDAGHATAHPAMARALLAATDRLAEETPR